MEETLGETEVKVGAVLRFCTFVPSPDLAPSFYSALTAWIQDGPGPLGFRAREWDSRDSFGGILFMALRKGGHF